MFDFIGKLATCIVTTCLLYTATFKSLGILQQVGYGNKAFWRWLKRKDNLYFNRLTVWSVLALFTGSLAAIAASLLGQEVSLVAFTAACFLFAFFYCVADKKYALKVPVNVTKRLQRLALGYVFVTAVGIYILLSVLGTMEALIANEVYSVFALAPFAFAPVLTPVFLTVANGVLSPFEKKNNAKYVKQAKAKLENAKVLRIGVVGSYGKTSVKNILASILSAKYSVIFTPESYNTPAGVAKTVNCLNVENAEIFIAEMGARRVGDVAELCELVKPDYAVFTGVCRQHMETFKTEENLFKAKSEIVKGVKTAVVCGAGLREKITGSEWLAQEDKKKCIFLESGAVSEVELGAKQTSFTLSLGEEKLKVETSMLGLAAVENIALAATLAKEIGMTAEEIALGIEKIKPIEHRLRLIESNGAYILDDAYNCSERSAKEAIEALCRFEGRKILVTPGIVEGGILEESINAELGGLIARANLDRVMLVGETLALAIKKGYLAANGDGEKLSVYPCLDCVKSVLEKELGEGDAVLFLNDLPDAY